MGRYLVGDEAVRRVSSDNLDYVPQRNTAKITSAQLLALNATERAIVPAPGAGLILIFDGALIYKPAGTAYAGIAATEELAIRYTDETGLVLAVVEATGFLDQTTAQIRWANKHVKTITADTPNDITPVANSPLVLHMLVGEITTGDSPLYVRTYYRVMPSTFVI